MYTSHTPSHAGRPRTKPPKEHKEWHYHLGGMRHSRVPLTPELKEALEVAYVSRIMSKNFRKEGQPEKERIARITGMDLDKVRNGSFTCRIKLLRYSPQILTTYVAVLYVDI